MEEGTLSETLRGSVGALLRRVYARFTAEALRDGPPSRDYVLLDTLADQDAGSQHELAGRLGINRTIMVGLIDRLQESGYVTRTRSPANRRSYVLSITPEGRAARDGMRQAVARRDARITAALTPAERRRLNELLSLLLPEREPLRTTAHLVAQAHYRLRRMGDALLAGTGLRVRHFGSLAIVGELGPCPQQTLAERMHMTEPTAAQIVDELVRLGLVARGQDPHDRRRYALELTDLGRERLVLVRETAARLREDIRALLGADATEELRALLGKLLTS
ncbi:MarR family winged helix-turn-helix transcriptional regulator [Nonomuraea sp. SBT364]|uniref:MarR family winged helix-turn-helix transcriptional regulator n=1 Tax=Nonomuraea sp. SBT364 TaxID=1580530 RepID=UPI00066A7890|nr:MarR family transcriptional regulator [Nonomuraea sp. SBT364]